MSKTTGVIDARGSVAYYTYDEKYVAGYKDALGRSQGFQGRAADTDALGYTSYFVHDRKRRLTYAGGSEAPESEAGAEAPQGSELSMASPEFEFRRGFGQRGGAAAWVGTRGRAGCLRGIRGRLAMKSRGCDRGGAGTPISRGVVWQVHRPAGLLWHDRAGRRRGRALLWLAAFAIVVLLLVALGVFDRISDWRLSRRHVDASSRAQIMQVAYYAVLGKHAGRPDARTLGTEFGGMMRVLSNRRCRKYVVASVEGRTYVAEVPEGKGDVVCIVADDGSVRWGETGDRLTAEILRVGWEVPE